MIFLRLAETNLRLAGNQVLLAHKQQERLKPDPRLQPLSLKQTMCQSLRLEQDAVLRRASQQDSRAQILPCPRRLGERQ